MSIAAEARSIAFGRPDINDQDRQAVEEVLCGHVLTHGPQCAEFEREFAQFLGNGAHAVSVSSGMAALHLAYLHLGIGPGDEVLVPAMTHIATVHAVEWVGARPVFVDCDPATGNVTAEGLAAAVTERTRALSVVHFQGIPCDMLAIVEMARRRNLRIIEDCALAVGARWNGRHAGLFGDAACFSFYPVKHLTCGEGGMFVTRDEATASAVHKLRAFGVDRKFDQRQTAGMYDVPTLGLNYRMSEMQAALGRSQLRRVDQFLAARARNFRIVRDGVSGMANVRVLDGVSPVSVSGHYSLSLVLENGLASQRDEAMRRLKEAGVGTSVYYPQPTPRMSYYRQKYGYDATRYPSATEIADHSLALPVGPHVSADDAMYLVDVLQTTLNELSA